MPKGADRRGPQAKARGADSAVKRFFPVEGGLFPNERKEPAGRYFKVKQFPWSAVDFMLKIFNILIGIFCKRLFFRDIRLLSGAEILPDKPVGIFVQSPFP
jgi:hypothetical protein